MVEWLQQQPLEVFLFLFWVEKKRMFKGVNAIEMTVAG